MHIVALSIKSKGTNDIFCIFLGQLDNAVFGKEIVVLENASPCGLSNVQQSSSGTKKMTWLKFEIAACFQEAISEFSCASVSKRV